jgi:hypothetical protein
MNRITAKWMRLLAPQRFHCLGALTSVKVGTAEELARVLDCGTWWRVAKRRNLISGVASGRGWIFVRLNITPELFCQ